MEKVRQSGNEARVRVMSYQYRHGTAPADALIVPDWAIKKYEWSTNADGSLKSLSQKFELHKGRDRTQMEASFDTKSGVTTIKRLGPDSNRVILQGLVLLRMGTDKGQLKIDYDPQAVPAPDIKKK